jgi:hypothetical protein
MPSLQSATEGCFLCRKLTGEELLPRARCATCGRSLARPSSVDQAEIPTIRPPSGKHRLDARSDAASVPPAPIEPPPPGPPLLRPTRRRSSPTAPTIPVMRATKDSES